MRKQILDDHQIKYILDLIDSKKYTQQEIAEMYHVSQGTISRYNKVKRMQFKIEKNAKLIARLNLEILNLKEKLNMDTSEERRVPDSFKPVKITTLYDGIIFGYYTENHLDVIRFIDKHPEYHNYTVVTKENPNSYLYMRTRASVDVNGYLIIDKDFGKLTVKNQLIITELEVER